jgi:hypothetical protein
VEPGEEGAPDTLDGDARLRGLPLLAQATVETDALGLGEAFAVDGPRQLEDLDGAHGGVLLPS